MIADFEPLLPVVMIGVIGWLIRQTLKNYEDKLDGAITRMERGQGEVQQEVRQLAEAQGEDRRRLSVLQAVLKEKGVLS